MKHVFVSTREEAPCSLLAVYACRRRHNYRHSGGKAPIPSYTHQFLRRDPYGWKYWGNRPNPSAMGATLMRRQDPQVFVRYQKLLANALRTRRSALHALRKMGAP